METSLFFNTRDEVTRIKLDRVMYFESDANYTHVIFANGVRTTILTSLVHLEVLISNVLKERHGVFIRIGKKYIINSTFVFQINVPRQRLILTDLVSSQVHTLTISKDAIKKLKSLYVPDKQDVQI